MIRSYRMTLFMFAIVIALVLGSTAKMINMKKTAKDLDTSATGYGSYGGQVHISVHRGPTQKHGYHYFAPFSYYVRQPEDNHKGYH